MRPELRNFTLRFRLCAKTKLSRVRRQHFPSASDPTHRLPPPSDYECSLWRKGNLTPTGGWVWLTSAHLCHHSSNKMEKTVIPLKSIQGIAKETTLLLLGNSIKISLAESDPIWLLSMKRDQVHLISDIIQSLFLSFRVLG